jgi:hypothetical protein
MYQYDILVLVCIAGLSPFQFFVELAIQQDRSQLFEFLLPCFSIGEEIVSGGDGFAFCHKVVF